MLLTLAVAAPARADRESDALHLLDSGIALYENGEFEAARAAFIRARNLVPEKLNPHRWLGLTEAKLHRCEAAISELDWFIARVAAEDPRRSEAVLVRDRCHDVIAPPPGTLVIDSNPRGVYVRIDAPDGPVWGVTPCQEKVAEGRHQVYLSRPGFYERTIEVKIERGRMSPLYVELAPLPTIPPPLPPPILVPPPVMAPPPAARAPAPAVTATKTDAPPPKKSRAWVAGVVVPIIVVGVALGVGLGVGLKPQREYGVLSPVFGQ